jgi:hypothetical protein
MFDLEDLSRQCLCTLSVLIFTLEGLKIRGKAIPVTGRGGPYVCETLRHTKRVTNLKFFNVYSTIKIYFCRLKSVFTSNFSELKMISRGWNFHGGCWPKQLFGVLTVIAKTVKYLSFLHFAYRFLVIMKSVQAIEEAYNSLFLYEGFELWHWEYDCIV